MSFKQLIVEKKVSGWSWCNLRVISGDVYTAIIVMVE